MNSELRKKSLKSHSWVKHKAGINATGTWHNKPQMLPIQHERRSDRTEALPHDMVETIGLQGKHRALPFLPRTSHNLRT